MRTASPARRAAGLLAVTTIGLSTAVLSVTGVASAVPEPLDVVTFTTDPDPDGFYDQDQVTGLTVPAGYCSVDWAVYGASGGSSGTYVAGDNGGGFYTETAVTAGDVFAFTVGERGGDAVAGTEEQLDENGDVVVPAEAGTPGDAGLPGGAPGTGDDADGLGGGGGGLTSVTKNGSPYLSAFGGDGGSDLDKPDHGGAGAGDETDVFPANPDADNEIEGYGDGVVSGFMIPCSEPPLDNEEDATPGAPTVQWVQGVAGGLGFQLFRGFLPDGVTITDLEYRLDGGAWTTATADVQGDFQWQGVIPGLTTGREYSVEFRFQTTAGPTEATPAETGTPVPSAPESVKAVAGVSSIALSWAPPAGEPGIIGYHAWVLPGADPQSDSGLISCTETLGADARDCLIGVPAGQTYSVYVAADTAAGLGEAASVVVDVPRTTVPATLPTVDSGDVRTSSGTDLVAGEKFTVTGSGYLRGSTVDLIVYSTPTVLGSAVVDADGNFSAEVTLPKELASGKHHLVSAGVDPNGNPRYLVTEVTVTGGVATAAATTGGGLAYTGSTPLPFVAGGVLALVVGGGLLVASRRRQA